MVTNGALSVFRYNNGSLAPRDLSMGRSLALNLPKSFNKMSAI